MVPENDDKSQEQIAADAATAAAEADKLGKPDGGDPGATNLLDAGKTGVPADDEATKAAAEAAKIAEAEKNFTPSPVWEHITSTDSGFTVPTDLTAENQQAKLDVYFQEKYKAPPVQINPIAVELHQAASQPDFDFGKWASSKTGDTAALNMNDEDTIRWELLQLHGAHDEEKNPNGIKDDEITEHMDGMGKIQKKNEAVRIRNSIKDMQASNISNISQKNEDFIKEQNKLMDTNRENMFNTLFVETKKIPEIGGMPVSQAQHEAFEPVFKELNAPRGEKESMIRELLSNDQTLYRTAFFLLRQNEFKVHMTDLKEKVKNDWWDKLDLNPETQDGAEGDKVVITATDEKSRLGRPDTDR